MAPAEVIRTYLRQLLLTFRLLRDRRVAWWMKLVGAAPFLYVILPFDLIPDFIPVLGQLDDVAIVWVGMKLFESLAPEAIVGEHRAALGMPVEYQPPPDETIHGARYRVVEDDEKPKRR
ncbi:DUF1232 domain-containing protein [Anaerolineae bacterium CFX9]|nr:DUF1232 domain-containing protein [Anaerolineae bacterium CFX9]